MSGMSSPSTSTLLRRAAGLMPSGVAILSGGGERLTVSTLQCVSFDPPWVSVALERTSRRGRAIVASGGFHARLLDAGERALAREAAAAAPDTPGLVELACVIRRVEPVGDHDLVLADVSGVDVRDGAPLVYWRRAFFTVHRAYAWLASPEALRAFVDAWERGVLPASEWTHAAHVAVGACYAVRHGAAALAHTRAGILRYNAAVGTPNTDTRGYHETLTRFWAGTIAALVAGQTDEWQAARLAVDRFGEDRDRHALFYSFDVVNSVPARRAWVPPDLTPRAGAGGLD